MTLTVCVCVGGMLYGWDSKNRRPDPAIMLGVPRTPLLSHPLILYELEADEVVGCHAPALKAVLRAVMRYANRIVAIHTPYLQACVECVLQVLGYPEPGENAAECVRNRFAGPGNTKEMNTRLHDREQPLKHYCESPGNMHAMAIKSRGGGAAGLGFKHAGALTLCDQCYMLMMQGRVHCLAGRRWDCLQRANAAV